MNESKGDISFPLAHVVQDADKNWKFHSLEEHLLKVAELASKKAAAFGSPDWAYLAGLWHDLGKYRSAFQNYIGKKSGYDPEAHIENGENRPDHSTAGALYAFEKLGEHSGLILAYLIMGHHAGLPDYNVAEAGSSSLIQRKDNGIKKNYLEQSLERSIPEEVLNFEKPSSKPVGGIQGFHLWLRMLFSCLVDADFLDTESFMSPEKTVNRSLVQAKLSQLKGLFDEYITKKCSESPNTKVNEIRKKVLKDCQRSAMLKPGIFSLTVPTGGGKTLSGMAFALEHAIRYGKERIIIVIPYTSIIEQTANQYREIFGDVIVEHHSNLESEKESSQSRLASENWDAPIIVTTNVQLLESLFAAKTSRCRKLHNIVNSVIVMDEAQLLPPDFLQPVLDVLRLLTTNYSVTLVLSTATQPAFSERQDNFGRTTRRGLANICEIISDVPQLYRDLNRVTVHQPINLQIRSNWDDIAKELLNYDSVLVIVNSRKDSRDLLALMPEDTLYLSGLMCGQHRSDVIIKIKKNLKEGKPIRVVSTQLVEAGVDLDFPVVYRALSGLDSIAQAAGRCNREGKLSRGKVVVFVPPTQSPPGMLRFAEQATRDIWHKQLEDPISHGLFSVYFEKYFAQANLDAKGILNLLTKDARKEGWVQFRSAAAKFKIIDDSATKQILIPYDKEADKWIGVLRAKGSERYLMRRLQRYTVTIYENDFRKLERSGALEQVQLGIWAICVTNAYDKERRGLLNIEDICGDSLIV